MGPYEDDFQFLGHKIVKREPDQEHTSQYCIYALNLGSEISCQTNLCQILLISVPSHTLHVLTTKLSSSAAKYKHTGPTKKTAEISNT
jgi:hypothetical protein